MKKSLSLLAAVLCIAVLIQSIPLAVIAGMIGSEAEALEAITGETVVSDALPGEAAGNYPFILGEMIDERTPDTKVFRMSDGSYTAAVYPTQVHYEENGVMKEIDYRFEETTVDGERYFETKAGPVSLRVPETIGEDSKVVFSSGDNSISFTLSAVEEIKAETFEASVDSERLALLSETVLAEVLTDEKFEEIYSKEKSGAKVLDIELSDAVAEHSSLMMAAPGAASFVKYDSIMNGIDLNYSISGTVLKEEIVLNRRSSALKNFSFTLDTGALVPVLNEDSSVSLVDCEGTEQLKIAAPFMFDSIGAESTDITVTLTDNGDGTYTYKLSPDKKWLASAARVYPITIDPPVTDSSFYTVKDTTGVFASSIGNLGNTGELNYLKVGNRYDSATGATPEVQAMLYSQLPSALTATTGIVHAYLYLYSFTGGFSTCASDMQIDAYMITSDWNTSDVMENSPIALGDNGRADYSNVLDYIYYNDSSLENDVYRFEITEAAQKWLDGTSTNYGIALRGAGLGNSESYARFFDSTNVGQTDQNGNALCPRFVYVYRDSKGIEDYWSFTSMEAGRSGVVAVNNYNGNLVSVQDVVSSTGNNMPVSVSLIYSVNSMDNGTAGMGSWRTNYHMKISACNLSFEIPGAEAVNYRYCFIDSDGTRHYLKEEGNEHRDEDGLGLTLTTADGAVTGYYYKIETKGHTEYQFDFYGRLIKITDPNGNYNRVVYEEGSGSDSSKNRIVRIEEGSKMSTATRNTAFTLDSASGDITVRSPEGNFAVLDFMSSTNRTLNGIIYEDNISTSFTYTLLGGAYYLSRVNDGRGHQTNIHYINGPSKRVIALQWGTSGSILEQYVFNYSHNSTKIMDVEGRYTTLQFNGYGHTVGIVDHTSSIGQSYEFGAPGGTGVDEGKENKLLLTSKTVYASENRITNGGINTSSDVNGFAVANSATGITKGFESGHSNTGAGSMKLTKADTCTSDRYVYQDVTGLTTGIYTLSAYINTKGVSLDGKGTYLAANIYNSNGYRTSNSSNRITYTTAGEWIRLQVSVTVVSGDTKIRAGVYFPSDTFGTVYVDDIQLEHNVSGGAGSFNQLNNASLSSSLSGWQYSDGFSTSYKDGTAPSGLKYVASVAGDPSAVKILKQTVNISGAENDVFIAGAWAKANSVPVERLMSSSESGYEHKKGRPEFGLHVTFYNGDTKVGDTFEVQFNGGCEGWQFITDKIIAPGNYTKIEYAFVYAYNTGSASVATPFLYKENYGQSYVYDENGNVVSSTDAAETEAKFAYQDDALTQSVSPTGSRYMYAYSDTTHNMQYAVSNSGQKISFAYNGSGDATSMLINDVEYIPALERTSGEQVNCYIVNAKNGRVLEPNELSAQSTVYAKSFGYTSAQMWQLKYLSGYVYSVRSLSDTSLGLSVSASGGVKIDTVTYNSSYVPNVPFKLAFYPNGDGTFRIATGQSGYEEYLCQTDNLHYSGSNSYTVTAGEYDENDPAFKWYIVSTASGADKMKTTADYGADGLRLISTTDAAGNSISYTYNQRGLVATATDPNGVVTYYTYDAMGRTVKVESEDAVAEYTYENDLLKTISVNGGALKYTFEYDAFGRRTAVKAGKGTSFATLATYSYDGQLLTKQTYGDANSNIYVTFEYDSLDRIVKKIYNGDSTKYIQYLYDPCGNLCGVFDRIIGQRTVYEYDLASRINGVGVYDQNGVMQAHQSVKYTDGKGTVEIITQSLFDENGDRLKTLLYEYTYGDASKGEMPDALYKVTMGSRTFTYTYDDLGRVTGRTVNLTERTAAESYTYKQRADDTTFTTPLVHSMTDFAGTTHTYTYDANGNITKEVVGNKTIEYVYDKHNRLIEYYDQVSNKSGKLTYDPRGNILKHISGPYKAKTQITQADWDSYTKVTYSYGHGSLADAMTAYNDTVITYDTIGNPLNWINGETLTWQYGRQLASVGGYSYTYNADGLRITKTGGGKTTKYYVIDGQYVGELTNVNGTEYLISYFYDENGSVAGIYVNNSVYYFVKNIQGDVVAILDYTGAVVAKYVYDAWGNIIDVTYADGSTITSATHVAHLNPFRYRGYMYDEETGFYYLRSRYYDPEVGRFLNADGLVSTGRGIDGFNMFAYCNNNPVMFVDPNGDFSGAFSVAFGPLRYPMFIEYVYEITKKLSARVMPIEGGTFKDDYPDYENSDEFHGARDIEAPIGTPVHAAFTGTVIECEEHKSYGKNVVIKSIIDGQEYITVYAHLQEETYIDWDVGTVIIAGDTIGYVGMTGKTDGPHLHFEMREFPFYWGSRGEDDYDGYHVDPFDFFRG
ncbi:MAG: peptidoglycan DD-metalloendopeptidase family protein [Clostridia bacterium]|nr:peptidoglycan DD-metalloendopeptidase family protein [Clostridia bacterium]